GGSRSATRTQEELRALDRDFVLSGARVVSLLQGLLHVLKLVYVLVEERPVQSCVGIAFTVLDSSVVFLLRIGPVLFLLGDSPVSVVSLSLRKRTKRGGLCAGFILSPADDPWRIQIEFGEIGSRLYTSWIQLNSAFEFTSHLTCQACGRERIDPVSFFAVSASQPEMVVTTVRCQRHGFLASGNGVVPVRQREIGTAKIVVGSRIIRRRLQLGLQRRDSVIHASL